MTHHRPNSSDSGVAGRATVRSGSGSGTPGTTGRTGRTRRGHRSLVGLTGVLGAVAATSLLASAAAAAPAAVTGAHSPAAVTHSVVTSHPLATAAAATRAAGTYWTPARMKSARDAGLLPATAGRSLGTSAHSTIPAGRIAGSAAKGAGPAALRAGVTPADTVGAPWPWYGSGFTRVTNGKVFFSTHDGRNWVCSAAIVNTAGKDMVWTAGHCVYGSIGGQVPNEGWHGNWAFVPDYSNGSAPYGVWTEKSATIPSSYYYYQDEPNDMAGVNLNTGPYGSAQIANVLGSQGFAYGGSGSRTVWAFGYPAAYPYNGQYLDFAEGTATTSGSYDSMASNLTGGSSGGPWLISFNGASGYVWGANTLSNGSTMWSPYFGSNAVAVYNAVANR